MTTIDLTQAIEAHLRSCRDTILECQTLREPNLLRRIRFAESLNLIPEPPTGALFGYRRTKPDFLARHPCDTLIEFKRIGFKRNANGDQRTNECDLKNGIAQVLEHAFCRGAPSALLVVLDGGGAAHRPWTQEERQYVQSFCDSTLPVGLTVLRVRCDPRSLDFTTETVTPLQTAEES